MNWDFILHRQAGWFVNSEMNGKIYNNSSEIMWNLAEQIFNLYSEIWTYYTYPS